jgi:hypothetical protein
MARALLPAVPQAAANIAKLKSGYPGAYWQSVDILSFLR